MNTLGLSMGDSLLVGWRMCVSTVLNWYARWPLKWQLSNLRVWLQVRYAFTPGDEAPVLPALNEAQQQRLTIYCKLQARSPCRRVQLWRTRSASCDTVITSAICCAAFTRIF